MSDLTQTTIDDFGAQWTRYRDNNDYYGSLALLQDIFGLLLSAGEVAGRNVADIGSGTGRIVLMLLRADAAHVTAVEPSQAMEVLRENTREFAQRVTYVHGRGESIPAGGKFDYVFSIGVLHHIPQPEPVVCAAYAALRPGGRMLIWIYGREGNEAYLAWVLPLRKLTRRLPDFLLAGLCHGMNFGLAAYVALCRWLPLPMRAYMRGHIAKLSWQARYLTIFDQLNPAEARYYSRPQAEELLAQAGFSDIRTEHRHGYSWTVIGTRPAGA